MLGSSHLAGGRSRNNRLKVIETLRTYGRLRGVSSFFWVWMTSSYAHEMGVSNNFSTGHFLVGVQVGAITKIVVRCRANIFCGIETVCDRSGIQ